MATSLVAPIIAEVVSIQESHRSMNHIILKKYQMKTKKKTNYWFLIALIPLLMCKYQLCKAGSLTRSVSPIRVVEKQEVYRYCMGHYYLLQDYIHQDVVREVAYEMINFDLAPIVLYFSK